MPGSRELSNRDATVQQGMSENKRPTPEGGPGPGLCKDTQAPSVRDRVRALVSEEPFAVLCTQGEGQPYGSVVAYAFSDDLRAVTFATPMGTWKYRLLSECDRVALVIDSRARFPEDMMKVKALTATGQAIQLDPGPEFDRWADLLTTRHPRLQPFVTDPSTALFRVDITRYVHVSRFQEVQQWIPGSDK
jgi:uncharacterized protein YhbP (UPF0306 family)